MPFTQVKGFDQNKAGKEQGWCLRNVRSGFSIGSKYDNAIKAWNADKTKHQDRNIPTGVHVPLWYSFKNDGHVNVQLPDGRVWSDGTIFASLQAYLNAKPLVKYLGWSEAVNDIRVLQYTADPTPNNGSLVINAGSWNARTAPNLNAAIIGGGRSPVLGGQQYGIQNIDGNGWANITFTGQSAWIGPKSYKKL